MTSRKKESYSQLAHREGELSKRIEDVHQKLCSALLRSDICTAHNGCRVCQQVARRREKLPSLW